MANHMAQKTWELENKVEIIDNTDDIYKYDKKQQQDILTAKPWEKDPHYFKEIKISALALLKMVMHARSGGSFEGKVDGYAMIVMDSFALPVEGTETRVNAQAQAYEYMAAYNENSKQVGRLENVIGWYHSHPGYGCWLSGIDVSTQMLNQQFQEPFVAIVIDPVRTITAGKVNIGAFRTYPKGYKAPNETPSEYQTIPLNKIEDFGVHCKSYYSLDISYFKSKLDMEILEVLWSKYWINTLTSSNLFKNKQQSYLTGQLKDFTDKLEQYQSTLGFSSGSNIKGSIALPPLRSSTAYLDHQSMSSGIPDLDDNDFVDSMDYSSNTLSQHSQQDKLSKIVSDGCKSITESLLSLSNLVIKDRLFNVYLNKNLTTEDEFSESTEKSSFLATDIKTTKLEINEEENEESKMAIENELGTTADHNNNNNSRPISILRQIIKQSELLIN